MIRADTKVRAYQNSLTLALSQREREFGGGISPASPMEERPDMLEKKYAPTG